MLPSETHPGYEKTVGVTVSPHQVTCFPSSMVWLFAVYISNNTCSENVNLLCDTGWRKIFTYQYVMPDNWRKWSLWNYCAEESASVDKYLKQNAFSTQITTTVSERKGNHHCLPACLLPWHYLHAPPCLTRSLLPKLCIEIHCRARLLRIYKVTSEQVWEKCLTFQPEITRVRRSCWSLFPGKVISQLWNVLPQ